MSKISLSFEEVTNMIIENGVVRGSVLASIAVKDRRYVCYLLNAHTFSYDLHSPLWFVKANMPTSIRTNKMLMDWGCKYAVAMLRKKHNQNNLLQLKMIDRKLKVPRGFIFS